MGTYQSYQAYSRLKGNKTKTKKNNNQVSILAVLLGYIMN